MQRPVEREYTFNDLRARVAGARAELRRCGVGKGDRVVAFLPNRPETLIAFLALRVAGRDLGVASRPSSARAA